MADIKSLLKEARKLIDEKNYKDAQECCKNILRKDKQNYFGLVLLGKSLQDSDQAPLAYQKAISSKRDQPLAWLGLAQYYESKDDDDSKQKLFPIYNEILYLQFEEDKKLEILMKLGQLGRTLKSSDSVHILVNLIKKLDDEKLVRSAETQLIEVLKTDVHCQKEDIPVIRIILENFYKKDPNDSVELILSNILLQSEDLNSAIEELINLPFFQKTVIKEYLCKWLCNRYMECMSFNDFEIERYIDSITENIDSLKYSGLLKSVMLYDKGQYLDAYKQCVPLVNYQEADQTESIFIIKCTIMLKKWPVAQKLATNFITKAKSESLAVELRKFLFVSLAKQRKWKQAIANAKLIPFEMMNMDEKSCLAECNIETNEPVGTILEDLRETENYLQLQSLLFLKQNKYNELVNLLQEPPENSILFFYLGKAYWELKEFDKCLVNLLKAAKLNPDHADTFLYLGHYYYQQKHDMNKAKKCYEKAQNLNNVDLTIAKSLSETYLKLAQSDLDFELLLSLTQSSIMLEPWINFRLGLHYLNKREWENAIINFRNVIKSNENDITAFECLADAYYSRGSYTSALRAYDKVMTLDTSKTSHCLTKIGNIHSLLTQYKEAISTFEKVLKVDPFNPLALKGIIETWMRVAKKKFAVQLHGSARDCAQNAVNYILKALEKQKHFTCFWKLLADTLMFITKLPNQYAYVYMSELTKSSSSEVKRKEKIEIYPYAISCYSLIAKQMQHVTSYDLAYAYFCYFQESKNSVNAHIAYNLTTACIKERPNCWKNWNLLGKICLLLKKFDISQHCFIKALQCTRKWYIVKIWCNLGTLYVKLQLHRLANYCFWRGQSHLPSYPQSWIGQALIAEAIREEEAMDLFRHASRLGYHPESALGYADWVCRTLKENKYQEDPELKYVIEGLYAITYAMDLIHWFSNFEPNNACASNIMGVLQECSGQFIPALGSYEKAFKYADDNKKNIVLLNIGRLLVRIEKYDEAVKIYKAITEASFDSTIGLALALFKNGNYEESYTVYDTALHWLCGNENEKSDVLVAMAGIVYMYKGLDDAKTILFHSIQTSQKMPTPHSLYSICALGLTHSEQSLTKLAIGELQKFERKSEYGYDIGFLKSYPFVLENNVHQAIKILSDSLHDHPSNALLWFCMAQYCLNVSDSKAKAASCCAQKALCAAHFGNDSVDLAKIIASASIAEHLSGDHCKGLLLAKEGLHMYPYQAEIWAALLFSLLSDRVWMEKKNWLLGAAGHMRRHLNISRPLSRWVSLVEKKLSR